MKPSYLLDEQMYFSGNAEVTLLHQIRELLKEQNELLKELKPKKVGEVNVQQQLPSSNTRSGVSGSNKHKRTPEK